MDEICEFWRYICVCTILINVLNNFANLSTAWPHDIMLCSGLRIIQCLPFGMQKVDHYWPQKYLLSLNCVLQAFFFCPRSQHCCARTTSSPIITTPPFCVIFGSGRYSYRQRMHDTFVHSIVRLCFLPFSLVIIIVGFVSSSLIFDLCIQHVTRSISCYAHDGSFFCRCFYSLLNLSSHYGTGAR